MLLGASLALLLVLPASASADASPHVDFENPLEGTNVSGEVELVVSVSTNVTNVSFSFGSSGSWNLIGQAVEGSPDTFNLTWDTEQVPDGPYDLLANATLDQGGYETEELHDVTVDNTHPRPVFLKPPRSNVRVNGVYEIVVKADPDVVSLDLYYDLGSGFVLLGSANPVAGSANWTLLWDTSGISEKSDISIITSAWDAAGNEGRTSVLGIEVDNVPPVVTLLAPADNATLDGYYLLQGNTIEQHLSDTFFEWRVDSGTWLKAGDAAFNATTERWTCLWNTYEVGRYEDVEVRFVAVDDLGQRGHDTATNVTITDLPPTPEFLSPAEGDHLTGAVQLEVASQNDTKRVEAFYHQADEWRPIGQALQEPDGVWRLLWSTAPLSLHCTTLRVVATDGSGGKGEASVPSIELDNTAPAPRVLKPGDGEYHIYGLYRLVAISDRDTISMDFHYNDGDEWVLCGNAEYNYNNDRWELDWDIDVRILDSAICATAVDEVGLSGHSLVANIELGLEPGDRPPRFLASMPEVIYFSEDKQYVLELEDHVDDNDPEKLKVYVMDEPSHLISVYGENTTGELVLTFNPKTNVHGQFTVRLIVYDPSNQQDAVDLTVLIQSVPDPPIFISIPPNLYVHPGIPYEFDYGPYIMDEDTDKANLSVLRPDDPHVSKNASNPLSLVFLYDEGDEAKSPFAISITVRDDENAMTNRSILVRVTEDWVPEQREPLPNLQMREDQTNMSVFNLDDYFFDRDHNTLYYSYGNTHVRVVIGNTRPHTVGIILPANWHGTDTVTFRATDPIGALLEDTITINVESVNDPPVFHSDPKIPQLRIHLNTSYHFDLAPYVEDVDDELSDLELVTGDPFATRSSEFLLGIRLTYPFREKPFDIEVVIRDPQNGTATQYINVKVTDNHPPELQSPPPNVVMDEGEYRSHVFEITSAWDEDWRTMGGDWRDLNFTFMCQRAAFTVNAETGWVNILLEDPDWNTYVDGQDVPVPVILRVIDAKGAFSEYVFLMTVLPVNDPPEVGELPKLKLERGIHYVDLRNYIRDPDTPFTELEFLLEDQEDPSTIVTYASVHGELLVLNFRSSKPGNYTLRLVVIDGEDQAETTLAIRLTAPKGEGDGSSLWLILLVAVATGAVAVYASRYLWSPSEPPSVTDVFLVYGDGVIIRHLSKRGSISMDEDLAIAMLTAIQEFVQQSMRSAQLKSMQAGENNILIERDPDKRFYIAVIHTGTVSEELRRAVNKATLGIREQFGPVLKKWDGNIAKFDGVEKLLQEILVITHAHIPEGVRFEMEGITSIEPGKIFLFQGKDVTRTHNIFRGLVEEQGSGLLISRVHPQRLNNSIAEAGADCVWLSKTPTKRGVSPSNTTMILHEITTYVHEHEGTVVCLDGLEYLLVHNPEDEVVAFINELGDMVQVDNYVMMIHVDPDALDEVTLAKLARDMVPVTDRR